MDHWSLMSGIVVYDQKEVQCGRRASPSVWKTLRSSTPPMALMYFAHHGPSLEIECREQVGSAVT